VAGSIWLSLAAAAPLTTHCQVTTADVKQPSPPGAHIAAATAIPPQLERLFQRLDSLGREKVERARWVTVNYIYDAVRADHMQLSNGVWLIDEHADTVTLLWSDLIPETYRKNSNTVVPENWRPATFRFQSVQAADFENVCREMSTTKHDPNGFLVGGRPSIAHLMVSHAAWKRGLTTYCIPILANDPIYVQGFGKYESAVLENLAASHFLRAVNLLMYADRREVLPHLRLVVQLSPNGAFAPQALDLIPRLEKLIAEQNNNVQPVDESTLSDREKAALYITQLKDLRCPQSGQPGTIEAYINEDYLSTLPPSQKLRLLGMPAVPALLMALEDETPTRTVFHRRDFDDFRQVWRVSDFAWYVLRDISHNNFGHAPRSFYGSPFSTMQPAEKAQVIQDVRRWQAQESGRLIGSATSKDLGFAAFAMIGGGLVLSSQFLLIQWSWRGWKGRKMTAGSKTVRHRWLTFSLRTLLLWIFVFSVYCAYVGSYYHLSRRAMTEMGPDRNAWLYVSYPVVLSTRDPAESNTLLQKHVWCERLFRPLSWIDNHVFGNRPPARE